MCPSHYASHSFRIGAATTAAAVGLTPSLINYVLSFQVYTGKDTTKKDSNLVSYQVVMDLLELYLGKGHWVFTDNYYSSPKLFADLLKKNMYATGTVRQNRKQFPEALQSQNNKLDVGQYRYARYGQIIAVLWRNRRDY